MSTYFSMRELRQKAGHGLAESIVPKKFTENAERVMALADLIREAYGAPLRVVSGYRSGEYNARCKGAVKSQHLTASALDLQPACKPIDRLRQVARLFSTVEDMLARGDLPDLGGLGYYPAKWIHIDIRPHADHVARWRGEGIGSEVT